MLRTISALIRAIAIAAPLLFLAPPPAVAQETQTHAESCAVLGYLQATNFNIGAVNICSYPIEIWILDNNGQVVRGVVEHDRVYNSGIARSSAQTSGWIWAACRAGYRPSVAINASNAEAIRQSQYQCVQQR